MNRVHKTLWSETAQCWQAVPETAKAAGKGSVKSASGGVLATVVMGLALTGGAGAQSPPPPASTQLPTGGSVARGSATISQTATAQAAAMTVNQSSQRAVINWDSFNLGQAASINFVQPNAQAVTLNRVNDHNPSQIFGRISANGQVFLSNPSGVYFSPTSSVDVGALVATSHRISDEHFMAGTYQFERNGSTGKVVNEGRISAGLGGYVALLAPEVQNAGVVLARAGTVALAAGEVISLQVQGGGLAGITTTPSTIQTLIENKLAVQAPDGQIILSAVALNKLQAGIIKHSGSLEANSLVAKGGKIFLEADDITLAATSKIEAKGPTGGGTVLVGGDWQGTGDMRQATKVTMQAGARIDASATDQGDGGKVVLWSDIHQADSVTRVNGSIKAEAGPNGGDGGQVETSGHGLEVEEAVISAQSFKGKDGLWLLDPYNITISSSANASTTKSASTFTASASGGVVNATTLQTALATSSVTVSTTGAGTDAGNITISSDLSWSSNKVLTLTANGGISGTGNIAMSGASGTGVVFNQAGTSNYSGNISGTNATVSKQGLGELTLSGNNTYGGITTVSAGTLKIGSSTALGTATSYDTDRTIVSAGTTLDLNGYALNESIGLAGTLTNTNSANVVNYTGRISLTSASTITADNGTKGLSGITAGSPGTSLTLGGSTGGSFSGLIGADGHSQPTLTKTGSGTWSLDGAAVYVTGAQNINQGTLKIGSANTNFFSGYPSSVTIASGAVLEMASNNAVSTILLFAGAGSIVKSGTGTFSLNKSTNSYSGGTTIANGILRAGSGNGINSVNTWLGTGPVTVLSGASLDIAGNKISNAITLNGTGYNGLGALQNNPSNTTNADLSGLITLGSDSSIMNNATTTSTLTLSNTGTITGSGYSLTVGGNATGSNYLRSIIGIGAGNVTKTGTGIWLLTGANTFDGNVYVNAGLLTAGNLSALGTTVGRTVVASGASLNFSVATGSTINEPITASGFGYNSTIGAIDNSYVQNLYLSGQITLTGTTRFSVSSSQTLRVTNTIDNGTSDVYKSGGGNLILTGTPNFSGTGGLKTGYAFVKPTSSTSVYGTSPSVSYSLFTDNAATTATTDNNISGTATYSGAPTSASAVGSYSLLYTGGLTSTTNALFASTLATNWTVNKANLTQVTASKTYDGLATVSFGQMGTIAGVNGETFSATAGTATISDQNVATTGKTLTNLSGLTLSSSNGGLVSNYNLNSGLPTAGSNNAVTISAANLAVTGLTANNKAYDGTATANLGGAAAVSPFAGDTVSLIGTATGTFVDANAGTGKSITTSGLSLSGAQASNYNLVQQTGLSADITRASLTITANNASKTYDGQAYAGGNGVSYSAFANNETSAVLGGALAYGGTSQGATNAGSYAITPSGLTSSNYAITYANGALTINKAALTVTANHASKTYGDANPTLSTTVSGFVNGETLATSGVAGSGSAITTATTSTGAGTATITAGVGSLTAANYDFSNLVNGTLTIHKAALTVTANNASKTYGDANPTLSTTVSGFVNGETLVTSGVAGSGSATTTATTTTAVGTAVITAGVGSLTASNYDFSRLVDGTLTIQAAPIQPSNNANQLVNPGQVMASLVVPVVIPPSVAPVQPAPVPVLPTPPGPAPVITIAPPAAVVAEANVPTPAPVVLAALPPANTDSADNPDNKDRPNAAAASRATTPSLQGEQVAYLRPAVTNVPGVPAAIPAAPSPAVPVATPVAPAPANVQLATAAPEAVRPVAAVANVNAPTTNVVSTGVLPITILRGNNAQPTSAGVAFEQNADTVSLRATDAPPLPLGSARLVFNDRLTTFMVANSNGTMVEFQGSLVNNRMVIVAPSNAARLVAQSDMNIVLAAAVTSLGRESRVMLAQLESVVLDLR